ncbi:hypothetical protein [Thiovibrio frasassiensis]|uniref:Uncharacterized protein n=1 Tax=Thiovibrio frasassiensis TaxID=2984131 RepID=A0A9X4RM73_9BACT|nr:hypothetical protein [Thiovibrio frasassiensis]MDG4476045.1 hypothetical protein [Thiovibrio frasassiensis]
MNSLIALLPVLVGILGYGFTLNRFCKFPIESTFLFVCASMVAVLYVGGLFDFLQLTAQAILIVGFFLFLIIFFIDYRKNTITDKLTLGLGVFLFFVCLLYLITQSECYSSIVYGDDFSHWGRVSKIVAFNHALVGPDDAVLCKDYPPGLALFDYLFYQFVDYKDSVSLLSRGVFVSATVIPLYAAIHKDVNKIILVGFTFFILSIIYFLDSGFHTLQVDLVLGLLFGVSLFEYFFFKNSGNFVRIIMLLPVVIVFPVIKQIGIFFSLSIAAIVIFDICFNAINFRNKFKLISVAFLMISFALLAHASWSIHVENINVEKTFNNLQISPSDLLNAFDENLSTERQKATIANYLDKIFPDFIGRDNRLSTQYFWALICVLFIFLIIRESHVDNRKWWQDLSVFFLIAVCFVGYLLLLLFVYLFSFGAYEGVRLASFERYVNTFLVGVIVFLFGISVSRYFHSERSSFRAVMLVIVCLMAALPNSINMLKDVARIIIGKKYEAVSIVSEYARGVTKNTPSGAKIFFVWQNSSGHEYHVFSYGILPRRSNVGNWCWSIGAPYSAGDVWTCQKSSNDFDSLLMAHDFLFVGHSDERFRKQYLGSFGLEEIKDGSLYKIINYSGKPSLINWPVINNGAV